MAYYFANEVGIKLGRVDGIVLGKTVGNELGTRLGEEFGTLLLGTTVGRTEGSSYTQ